MARTSDVSVHIHIAQWGNIAKMIYVDEEEPIGGKIDSISKHKSAIAKNNNICLQYIKRFKSGHLFVIG